MAFEVRCPNCNKLYAAEWRLVGKRIRCRGCQHVFQIGAPAEAPVHAAAEGESGDDTAAIGGGSSLSPDASHVGSSDLQKTREGVVVPPSKDGTAYEESGAGLAPMLKPSVPQSFPGSQIVEAWLPLALGLISAVWVVSQTFGSNQTGRAWVALMRIAIIAVLYLALIVPVTKVAIKSSFRKIKRVLPPSPYQRTAFTFALPLTLGYVFWLISSGGVSSLITGLLLGIILMAAVYWLLFRLDPQEAAQSYLLAASTFLGGVIVSGLILVGAGMWVNKAMIATDAARDFTENPVSSPLAWNVPPPAAPKPKVNHAPQNNEPAVVHTESNPPASSPKPQPSPPANDAVARESNNRTEKPTQTPTADSSTVNPPKVEDPGAQASTETKQPVETPKSKLFDLTPNGGGDTFLQKLRGLAWVKDASCPTEEDAYDTAIDPLTPSPYIGFLKASLGQLELCQLSPAFAKVPRNLMVANVGPDASKTAHRLAIAPDASALLRLWPQNGGAASVDIMVVNTNSVRRPPASITISPNIRTPNGVVNESDAMLEPELLGALPDDRFLIRWSSPGRQIIQVYSYWQQPPQKPKVQFELKNVTSDVFAVDPTGSWYANVQGGGRVKSLLLTNLRNGNIPSRTCMLPADSMGIARADCTGITFNLNPNSKMMAALFEDSGKAWIQSWVVEGAMISKQATFELPRKDAAADAPPSPALAWVGDGWLVHGSTLVSDFTDKIVGNSLSAAVTGVQVLNVKSGVAYLSYIDGDGHPRTAVVTVEPGALRPSANSNGAAGGIKTNE